MIQRCGDQAAWWRCVAVAALAACVSLWHDRAAEGAETPTAAAGPVAAPMNAHQAPYPSVMEASRRALYAAVDGMQHVMKLGDDRADPMAMLRAAGSERVMRAVEVEAKLEAMAEEQGLKLAVMRGVSVEDLRRSGDPLVIKVRSSAEVKEADHFVVLERMEGASAVIYAGPGPMMHVPLEVLAWYFGGTAIAVGDAAARYETVTWSTTTARRGQIAAGIIGAALLAVSLRKREVRGVTLGRSVMQAAALAAASGAAAAIGSGLYAGARITDAAAAVAKRGTVLLNFYEPSAGVAEHEVHDVSAEVFRAKMLEGGVLLDVRGSEPYRAEHVVGALDVPELNERSMRLKLAGIPKDQTLLVYCASATCPRGRVACGVLRRLGYTHVLHYAPGWADLKNWSNIEMEKGAAAPALPR